MSTFRVSAERLDILPHPNADALDLAVVDGYRAVVLKDRFLSGDYAIYIPEQAILPPELIEELGLTGRLAGKNADRVKAIRLRGELSQGIVCLPAAVVGIDLAHSTAQETDFAELLGISKWTPEVPEWMIGKLEPAPSLIQWLEVENIKRYPGLFEPGEQVVADEKLHGICTLVSLDRQDDRLYVSSKGYGAGRLAISEDDTSPYWRAVRQYDIEDIALDIGAHYAARAVGIFGETFGGGIQDLAYGVASAAQPGFAAFDIAVDEGGGARWLDRHEFQDLAYRLGLPTVPRLYEGPYDYDLLAELSEGPETLSGNEANIREGLVVRPSIERYSPILGGRTMAKFISPAYLLRKGGTEYE